MSEADRAHVAAMLALAAWRAARDAEAYVAHLVSGGHAHHQELVAYRRASRRAHEEYTRTRKAYLSALGKPLGSPLAKPTGKPLGKRG